jgi:hypothetical protein
MNILGVMILLCNAQQDHDSVHLLSCDFIQSCLNAAFDNFRSCRSALKTRQGCKETSFRYHGDCIVLFEQKNSEIQSWKIKRAMTLKQTKTSRIYNRTTRKLSPILIWLFFPSIFQSKYLCSPVLNFSTGKLANSIAFC